MADKLIPCPFCGGTELSYGGSEHSEVFIVCDNCLAHGPHTGAEQGKAPDAPLWNKRQPPIRLRAEFGAEPEPDPVCWHCLDVLIPDTSRPRCERCPDECDVEGCEEPGCAGESNAG